MPAWRIYNRGREPTLIDTERCTSDLWGWTWWRGVCVVNRPRSRGARVTRLEARCVLELPPESAQPSDTTIMSQ